MENVVVVAFNSDVNNYDEGVAVCVTGIIRRRWNNKRRIGIELADFSGAVKVSLTNSSVRHEEYSLIVGKRVRVYGQVALDAKEDKYINQVSGIEVLEEISDLKDELDIMEQEVLVRLSMINKEIREHLVKLQFTEIATRVISRNIGEEILEPLLIEYPGFGSPVYLSPSPSSQLSEFLAITMLPKVFTVTTSFSSSYRFRNGGTEIPIIMAKAINLSEEEENNTVLGLVRRVMNSFLLRKGTSFKPLEEEWGRPIEIEDQKDDFLFVKYKMDIPTLGRSWNSVVNTVKRLFDRNGNILVECVHELVNGRTNVCTITFYPSQLLGIVSKTPKRQIQNLWRAYDGGNLYG